MNSLIRYGRRFSSVFYSSSSFSSSAAIKSATTTSTIDDGSIKLSVEENEKTIYNRVDKSYEQYIQRRGDETSDVKRARLVYQSRKRGTSENGILLANFASKYLASMNEIQLDEFDKIIGSLYNEWDIYYWITNAEPIPVELQSNSILHKLKEFCLNGQQK